MKLERFELLAAVIAAHPERKVVGRTRLQKTVKLLQRLGLGTDYDYMLYFYGPYSESLQAEIGVLEQMGLIREEGSFSWNGRPYYILRAKEEAESYEVTEKFGKAIQIMSKAELVVLELAATYDAFRETGMTHEQALIALRLKKGAKCENGNEEKALELLGNLGLTT